MISEEVKKKYKATIGIECHVQLKTKTKLFAAVGNDARDADPNTLISHICVGMPGALPVLNQGALDLVIRAAFALGAQPEKFSHFDRKHYFYPDLPKGYQITQYANPLIAGGHVHININGEKKCIGITRAHLEEDAGKTTHPDGADYSLVDLNRAGTPLLEIVSEPDINSAAEAKAFARELYLLMKYAGVSDVDLYHGNMRFDVNTSVSKTDKSGVRTEVKNLNSFRSVEAAVDYEIDRQIEVLEKGEKVIQETRGWDEAKQNTTSQRSKEEAEDYRYFPEPDVPPVELEDEYIDKIKKELPMLPPAIRMQLSQIDLESPVIEDLLDMPEVIPIILEVLSSGKEHARRAAFWLIQSVQTEGNEQAQPNINAGRITQLSQMVETGQLNSTSARQIFAEMAKSPDSPKAIAERLDVLQVSDENELEEIVKKVIEQNPKAAEDVKKGEEKAVGFLVGQVMKLSGGKANPALVQAIIKKSLWG